MSNFKRGDLVMVVRPRTCCGYLGSLGAVSTVISAYRKAVGSYCDYCGLLDIRSDLISLSDGFTCEKSRLKKIDPPAEGDSLPTRRDLEVPA